MKLDPLLVAAALMFVGLVLPFVQRVLR